MSKEAPTLAAPDDLDACRALIGHLLGQVQEQAGQISEQAGQISEQAGQIETLKRENEALSLAYAELLRRAFQKRSERYLADPQQLVLDFGAEASDAADGLAAAVEESQQTVAAHTRRRPRKPRHEQLPAHLERREIEVSVPDELRNCPEHGPRQLIGYDVVESLCFKRPELWVAVRKYAKFACPPSAACGVVSPERPTALVEGNRYETSVAAEVITGKYGYHLPVYRQQDYFAGSGWTPARSTLLNLLVASAWVLRPLVEHVRQAVLASGLLGTDDTPVTLLLPASIPKPDPGDPRSMRIHEVFTRAVAQGKPSVAARMWAYRSLTVPLNVFDFTVSRHRDGPDLFLRDFRGTLMADCYSGYQQIEFRSAGQIQRAACGAHARRKVFEAREVYPAESGLLLQKFQQLYDLEDRAKHCSADERRALRQAEAAPVWASMGAWLQGPAAAAVLPKSKLGEALTYLRNHWEPLQLYLTDGRLPIDNNDVEQLMKQVALGRKNWLFIGSVAAGQRAADFLTLVSSALRNDLDVWAYIKDVLDQLLAGMTDYAALRPDTWRQSHPEAIRQYRVAERRDRAERKQLRRAHRRTAHQPLN
jgi:transposase